MRLEIKDYNIWRLFELLETVVDESYPDTELPQIYQC